MRNQSVIFLLRIHPFRSPGPPPYASHAPRGTFRTQLKPPRAHSTLPFVLSHRPCELILEMKPATWTSSDVLLLIALVAVAFNLRAPFTAVAPIVSEIQADLGINKTVAGLLTSIPVLCFGLLAPLASKCIARTSVETSVYLTLIGVTAGIALRSSGGIALALGGTFLIGAAITIGNIVSLVLIARDFPQRTAAVMGVYTSALNVGPIFTAAIAEPLARRIGWRWTLVTWSSFALIAMVLWTLAIQQRRRLAVDVSTSGLINPDGITPDVHVLKRPIVWLLIAAFAAHLLIYYSMSAWLPEYLQQAAQLTPTAAGLAAAFYQMFALSGTIGVPILSKRFHGASLLIVIGIVWVVTTCGLLVVPRLWPMWCMTGGFAAGGGVTVIFMLGMAAANGLDENRKISAAVQGVGYLLAASGPVTMGALAEWTGSWTAGLGLLSVWGVILIAVATALASFVRS
jgi:CP family cyanate transporter-like MFS transporter